MSEAIFATAYFPPIDYIYYLIQFRDVNIEIHENFPKQTIRNRCHILSANGIQTLIVPVLHENKLKILTKDLKICYSEPWQRIHWSALYSAYNKSPYFEYYKDEFEKIIFSNKKFLLDLNIELLHLILKLLDKKISIRYSEEYKKLYKENDFRFLSGKKNNVTITTAPEINYLQVFNYKFGFVPKLSIVDFLFNSEKERLKGG